MRARSMVALAAVGLLALALQAPAAADSVGTYQVTITNLTTGQPLTPPVVATHGGQVKVFQVGQAASFGVKEIAENGNITHLLDALKDTKGVDQVLATTTGPLLPEGTPGDIAFGFDDEVTFTITAEGGARFLSFVSMLVCTNDGFTGVDRLKLPNQVGDAVVVQTNGYDAGTEINTEDFVDIVPPCQPWIGVSSADAGTGVSNPALAEGGVIHHHPGIDGVADVLPGVVRTADLVPAVHGWTDPVAQIVVVRVG